MARLERLLSMDNRCLFKSSNWVVLGKPGPLIAEDAPVCFAVSSLRGGLSYRVSLLTCWTFGRIYGVAGLYAHSPPSDRASTSPNKVHLVMSIGQSRMNGVAEVETFTLILTPTITPSDDSTHSAIANSYCLVGDFYDLRNYFQVFGVKTLVKVWLWVRQFSYLDQNAEQPKPSILQMSKNLYRQSLSTTI